MTNRGLEVALHSLGIDLHRAKVGDRYVMELMREHGSLIGGESSGHIICLDRTTTGDGIVSALQVLHALARSGRTLGEARQGMSKYPQTLRNIRLAIGSISIRTESSRMRSRLRRQVSVPADGFW